MPKSPLAPAAFPSVPPVAGARFAVAQAGVRYQGRHDVMLAHLSAGTVVAGVFTTSSTCSAAVQDCQRKMQKPDTTQGAAIVVNSGNANTFTGAQGHESVQAICDATAAALSIPSARVFSSSTGVIGEPLPYAKIINALPPLVQNLSNDALKPAAHAIMTTDTFAKGATQDVQIGAKTVRICGIAKGSGMIAPNMATMLVYLFTDAVLSQKRAQQMLGKLCDETFNAITVDSDTSTSDTLLLCATGKSGVDVARSAAFEDALHHVMLDLSHQVVRDGEGATKFVQVDVSGALSAQEARAVAMATANSPLVKTAIAGEDPNWGRIVMAAGKSGAALAQEKLCIYLGDILVAQNGMLAPSYTEAQGAAYMKNQDLRVGIDLGLGTGKATVWTTDLTHEYIKINADYRS